MDCTDKQAGVLVEKLPRDLVYSLMSTNHVDLPLVHRIAQGCPSVVPYYGIHPWYSHLFSTDRSVSKAEHYNAVLTPAPSAEFLEILPDPIYLHDVLHQIRQYASECEAQNRRYGIGEAGLDKVLRVPTSGWYGNPEVKENVSLSNCRVAMDHQIKVFTAQLALASELRKPVSLHCVKAHGAFFDTLGKSRDYSGISAVILHSYTGSIDQAKQWLREYKQKQQKLLFSFSNYINATDQKLGPLQELLSVLADNQVLVETDMPLDRFIPARLTEYSEHEEKVTEAVRQAKQWTMDTAKQTLVANNNSLYT